MVKLEELEDEHFLEKPSTTKDESLLVDDDDDDYTDTDSEISSTSDLGSHPYADETLIDRLTALKDIIPPQTRSKLTNLSKTIASATNTSIEYGGKGLWVIATSILLLGLPYALALGDEQGIMEEERQRTLMAEGAQGILEDGGEAKASL